MTEPRRDAWQVIRAGAGAVMIWRVLALLSPHPAFTDPAPVRNGMAVVGLVFLACGLWAYRRAPGPATALFALHALCAGMHWGGAVGLGPPRVRTLVLVFYVVVSSTLAQALLLHLAWVFPTRWSRATRRGSLAVLYLPVAAGGLMMAFIAVSTRTPEGLAPAGVPLLAVVGTLYGFGAVVVWFVRWVTRPEQRQHGRFSLLLGAFVLGALPNLVLSGMAPDLELVGLSNLPVVSIPVALAYVLTRTGSPDPAVAAADGRMPRV